MKRIFYIVAIILAIAWVLASFVFHTGRGMHILILLSIVCWLHAMLTIPAKKYILSGRGENNTGKQLKSQN